MGKSSEQILSIEDINTGEISIGKDVQYHASLGNCKLKQWDTTTYILEWLNPNTNNTNEDTEQRDLSLISRWNAKWYSRFGKSLAVSYKTKHTLTIWPNNCVLWYLLKWVKNMSTQRRAHRSS